MPNDEMPSEEQLRGIFKVIGEEVPELLEKLTKILYGAKESEEFGKAIGAFYKTLKESGMSNEQAFQLTKEYMGNLNIGNMMKGMAHGRGDRDEQEK